METPKYHANNSNLVGFSDSSSVIDMKEMFFKWLLSGNFKKHTATVWIASIDSASTFAIKKKICLYSLWGMTQHSIFKSIYQKLLDAKLFRVSDKNTYQVFIKAGELYLKFLKEKPWKNIAGVEISSARDTVLDIDKAPPGELLAASSIENTPKIPDIQEQLTTVQANSRLTIKDAIVNVMKATGQSMTAETIYNKIIGNELYQFGAKNPVNVVRNILEKACDNSDYSAKYKNATSCFHSEKKSDGKNVYSLLGVESAEVLKTQETTVGRFYMSGEENTGSKTIFKQPSMPSETSLHKPITDTILLPNSKILKVEDIIDLDEAQLEMDNILHTHFVQFCGYSNKRLLFEAAKITLPLFLNDNGFKDEDTVLAVAKHLLGNSYIFGDLHIWQNEPNYPKSVLGVVVGFGRAHGGIFTDQEAMNYLKKLKITQSLTSIIRTNNGKETFVLYDESKIVLAEYLNLSDEKVAAIYAELHKLFEERDIKEVEYVIPRDISAEWFARLPKLELGLGWTPLLLQEIIARYPNNGIKVVLSGLTGQSIYTLAPAFTIESSMLYTFADVIHLYLLRKQDFVLPKKLPAENLRLILREAGMLTGNELIYNLHKVLGADHRFAFSENNQIVFIRER